MKTTDPTVSIIIVNWNNAADTRECLRSLQTIHYSCYDIIVVDNGSTGDDVEILRKEFGDTIILLESGKNLGFSGGNNVGIEYALGRGVDYVLLLNNDTIVDPDFLRLLVDACADDERCGMAAPKICFHSAPAVIWSAGGVLSKFRASGFTRGEGEDAGSYASTENVTFASGCCLLIKADVIRHVGLWDASYFLYVEDADYCYRMTAQGYLIRYVGTSLIYHKVNRTTKSVHSLLPVYYATRNRFFFKDKFERGWSFAAGIYLWSAFASKCLWWAVKGRRGNLLAFFRAVSDYKHGKNGFANVTTDDFKDTLE